MYAASWATAQAACAAMQSTIAGVRVDCRRVCNNHKGTRACAIVCSDVDTSVGTIVDTGAVGIRNLAIKPEDKLTTNKGFEKAIVRHATSRASRGASVGVMV